MTTVMIKQKVHLFKIHKTKLVPILGCALLTLGLIVGQKIANPLDKATAFAQSKQPTFESINDGSINNSKSNTNAASTAAAAASAAAAAATAEQNVIHQAATTVKKATPAATTTASNGSAPPISHAASLYVNPNSDVASQAKAWASTNPTDAGLMNRLASTPMADWFGDFSGNISSAVNSYVSAASNAGQVPVLVAYNIPERDCGGYSSGGAASASAYETWISQFASAIGNRNSIVVVEPDALASEDCLSATDQQTREQLLSFAVQSLRTNAPKSAIYMDGGNSNWRAASVMASRLSSADVGQATGFSLNVSNFYTTSSNTSYGAAISGLLGGKHFVIDTSRNGSGPDSQDDWCNPEGRSFGQTPTLQTGNGLIDAYLWIKNPGESDGQCGSVQAGSTAPAAGAWWPQYALMLANDSGW
jgi:endoglucanase